MAINSTQEIKDKIKTIGEKYNLKSIFLFGSTARGNEKPGSDIDLHIYSKQPMTLIQHANILSDCRELFNQDVDIIMNKGCDESFLNSIQNDELLVYEG